MLWFGKPEQAVLVQAFLFFLFMKGSKRYYNPTNVQAMMLKVKLHDSFIMLVLFLITNE